MADLKINEQDAVFDERILDRWGNEFRFDHVKGLAEWIKNSIDAYIREGFADDEQYVFLRFTITKGQTPQVIECIDWIGMTHDDIIKAFKRWGDPDAAKRGRTGARVYGGHGNGGKFYMRQMFEKSRFISWRKGYLNVFGFNERKKYGFANGFEDKAMSLQKALDYANLSHLQIPDSIKKLLDEGKTGFTVVVGERPKRAQRKNSSRSILARLRVHPQARRLVRLKSIFTLLNDESEGSRLEPEAIVPKAGFEGPYEYDIPDSLSLGPDNIVMTRSPYPKGKLSLRTSEEPFNRLGDRATLNCIDILGEVGGIASYPMNELGFIRNAASSEFIFGECYCPILEDPEDDCTRNDREKLVDSERTRALLSWICEKVNHLADQMAEQAEAERHDQELKQSSQFNELLNRWKNRFMSKLYAAIFVGPGVGGGFGGTGGGGSPGDGHGDGGTDGGGGNNGKDGGGSGDKKKPAARFPIVLLSNHDPDPLHPETGGRVNCEPRHPPIFQRIEDVRESVYWINTQAPFARKILDAYGPDDPRWRDYMFHRYIDIIIKQSIYEAGKRQTEFTASDIDGLLEKISKEVYAAAAEELYEFLFRKQFDVGTSTNETNSTEQHVSN